jgi:hypothetical protein
MTDATASFSPLSLLIHPVRAWRTFLDEQADRTPRLAPPA